LRHCLTFAKEKIMQDSDDRSESVSSTQSTAPASTSAANPAPAADDDGDGRTAVSPPTPGLSPTNAEAGEGQTGVIGGAGRDRDAALDEANQHIEVMGDPDGKVTNTPAGLGTIQREPTPEELPADAKVAPIAEQVAPNQAAQAVGSLPQPETVAGVEQPKEGEKSLPADGDTSDATRYLPEDSDQHEEAERAAEDAARDADRGRV
jgi:hypothetical protein